MESKTALIMLISVLTLLVIVIGTSVWHLTRPECLETTEKICYEYIPHGGIFGGIAEVIVSCDKEHDFYVRGNYHEGETCKDQFNKYT